METYFRNPEIAGFPESLMFVGIPLSPLSLCVAAQICTSGGGWWFSTGSWTTLNRGTVISILRGAILTESTPSHNEEWYSLPLVKAPHSFRSYYKITSSEWRDKGTKLPLDNWTVKWSARHVRNLRGLLHTPSAVLALRPELGQELVN